MNSQTMMAAEMGAVLLAIKGMETESSSYSQRRLSIFHKVYNAHALRCTGKFKLVAVFVIF